jgi:hypothetical protein
MPSLVCQMAAPTAVQLRGSCFTRDSMPIHLSHTLPNGQSRDSASLSALSVCIRSRSPRTLRRLKRLPPSEGRVCGNSTPRPRSSPDPRLVQCWPVWLAETIRYQCLRHGLHHMPAGKFMASIIHKAPNPDAEGSSLPASYPPPSPVN